jgi:hypothetical protein
MTWAQLSEVFGTVAKILLAEWRCRAPAYSQVASETEERGCDFWCRKLSKKFGDPISPPEQFRPWIIARLASAAADAELHHKLQDKPCPTVLTPEIVAQYLIDEWHHALKARWNQLDRIGEQFFSE